jgi:hypothetical protein
MPRHFLSNFDFEAGLSSYLPASSKPTLRRNNELAFAWLSIAQPGDVILVDQLPDPAFAHQLESLGRSGVSFAHSADPVDCQSTIVPWGWEPRIVQWADRRRLSIDAPLVDVVRDVNSRGFSFDCEEALRCGLDGQCVCSTISEAERSAAAWPRWLVKARFGAAGRERVLGSGGFTAEQRQWVERSLRRDGAVYFEPFVETIEEIGVQWDVPPAPAVPRLMGVATLLTDDRGQYRGSVFTNETPAVRWSETIALSREAARKVQQLGYFGPLGIDAMCYRDRDGNVRFRALQDVNARYTMGRLSLGWRDRLLPGQRGVMRCGRFTQRGLAENEANCVAISPVLLGQTPVVMSIWLEIGHGFEGNEKISLAESNPLWKMRCGGSAASALWAEANCPMTGRPP